MAVTGLPEMPTAFLELWDLFAPAGLNLVGFLLSLAGTHFAWLFCFGGEPVRRWLPT